MMFMLFNTELHLFEHKVFSLRNISMDGYVWNPENDGATGYSRRSGGVAVCHCTADP